MQFSLVSHMSYLWGLMMMGFFLWTCFEKWIACFLWFLSSWFFIITFLAFHQAWKTDFFVNIQQKCMHVWYFRGKTAVFLFLLSWNKRKKRRRQRKKSLCQHGCFAFFFSVYYLWFFSMRFNLMIIMMNNLKPKQSKNIITTWLICRSDRLMRNGKWTLEFSREWDFLKRERRKRQKGNFLFGERECKFCLKRKDFFGYGWWVGLVGWMLTKK